MNESVYEDILCKFDKEKINHINLVGQVPFESVSEYYRKSKIGVNYHKLNKQLEVAMPLKIFEYMKHGLAVVTSNLPPINKFMENGLNGVIVEDNSVKGFSDAIQTVIQSYNLTLISDINKRCIMYDFNWESQEKKLMQIYEDLYNKIGE